MSRTVKKINGEKVFQQNTTKHAGEIIRLPDRYAKIAEIAYYKAQNRNFTPGYELEDWLDAEYEFHF